MTSGWRMLAEHMGDELWVIVHPHVVAEDVPRTTQPIVAAHGEQPSRSATGPHPTFDDGAYPAHDGDRAGMVVLGLPCRQGAPFEVDVPAFETPQFPAAERLAGKEGSLQRGGGLDPALAAYGHVHDVAGAVRTDAPGQDDSVFLLGCHVFTSPPRCRPRKGVGTICIGMHVICSCFWVCIV